MVGNLLYIVLLAGLLVFTACSSDDEGQVLASYNDYDVNGIVIKDGVYTDYRDGQNYKVILIENTYWFAENLNYEMDNSWCFNESEDSCAVYGRLYDFDAAVNACPDGWFLPSPDDWNRLASYVEQRNSFENGGTSLKSVSRWVVLDSIARGTNRFGFNALPGGRKSIEGDYLPTGKYGYFWTRESIDGAIARGYTLTYENEFLDNGEYYRGHGMSVRCVANSLTYGSNISKNGPLDSSYLKEIPIEYGTLEYQGQTYKTVVLNGMNFMAENLNYETGNSWCYKNSADSCKKYGRLYDFETAKSACPEGWELLSGGTSIFAGLNPSKESFDVLREIGASQIRAEGTWYKQEDIDLWGVNLMPAGGYDISADSFFDVGYTAYMWMFEPAASGVVGKVAKLIYSNSYFDYDNATDKFAYSVRCVESATIPREN